MRMSFDRTGLLVLVMAAVAFSGSLSAGERQGPRITVNDARHDFGMVDQGTQPEHIFEIKNTGDEMLVIRRLDPT